MQSGFVGEKSFVLRFNIDLMHFSEVISAWIYVSSVHCNTLGLPECIF